MEGTLTGRTPAYSLCEFLERGQIPCPRREGVLSAAWLVQSYTKGQGIGNVTAGHPAALFGSPDNGATERKTSLGTSH